MTTTPPVSASSGSLSAPEAPEPEVVQPRYAAQRMLAAHMGRLPQRILTRAQSEGLAHRRLEAATTKS